MGWPCFRGGNPPSGNVPVVPGPGTYARRSAKPWAAIGSLHCGERRRKAKAAWPIMWQGRKFWSSVVVVGRSTTSSQLPSLTYLLPVSYLLLYVFVYLFMFSLYVYCCFIVLVYVIVLCFCLCCWLCSVLFVFICFVLLSFY